MQLPYQGCELKRFSINGAALIQFEISFANIGVAAIGSAILIRVANIIGLFVARF